MEDGSGLWEVGAYFTQAPDEVALALLAAAHGARPFAVSELPETDWVAHVRRELHPVEAGRFFVYGSHDADKVPSGRVALLIEAAMAFGTGHHGTTQGCLEALERLIVAGAIKRNVVDIGCGTAVLALAAAKVWPGPVLASDIDAVAVEVAEANVAANGEAGRVRCLEAAGFDHADLRSAAPFDLIFANILKGPLVELAPDVAAHCAQGGHVRAADPAGRGGDRGLCGRRPVAAASCRDRRVEHADPAPVNGALPASRNERSRPGRDGL